LEPQTKLPQYFDDTLFIYEWSRHQIFEIKLDQNGEPLKINRLFSEFTFNRPMDMELGPDGALYILEWGTNFGFDNVDSKLIRMEFTGNLPALVGDYDQNRVVGAADYTTWRDTLGQSGTSPFSGADGNGNGVVDQADQFVWRAQFGQALPLGGGSDVGAFAESDTAAANRSHLNGVYASVEPERPFTSGPRFNTHLTDAVASSGSHRQLLLLPLTSRPAQQKPQPCVLPELQMQTNVRPFDFDDGLLKAIDAAFELVEDHAL
jgi:hypothetical protein